MFLNRNHSEPGQRLRFAPNDRPDAPLPFRAPAWFRGAHAQTLGGYLLGRLPGYRFHHVGLRNESVVLPTNDGTGDHLLVHVHRQLAGRKRPAVILVHGLEGDANSAYMIHMADKLLAAGFHVVRMNLRSCGASAPYARFAYNAGLTIDLETVLCYAREQLADRVALVGISLGANLSLKLLGEDDAERDRQRMLRGGKRLKRSGRGRYQQALADTFVAISPPLDLYLSCELLDGPDCRLYRRQFLTEIKARARAGKYPEHSHGDALEQELAQIKTFFDFDHRFVARAGGYRGAVEYYEHASSGQYVSRITQPGLILHSRDDPLIDPAGWDSIAWRDLPHITAHETLEGGHVGWVSVKHGEFPDRRWMDYRVLHYLTQWRDQ